MTRMAVWPLVWAALATVAAAVSGAAADASWGLVDMARVGAEYGAMGQLNDQFQQFQMQQDRELQLRHKTRLLLDEERQEFLDLSQVAAPTEARNARLAELESLSGQRERRRFELRKKENCSETEAAELKQLDELYGKRMEELAVLEADLKQTRLAKFEELSKLVTESVNSAVKAVAEEKKLLIVVRKETVLFGGVDITEEVLARLNETPLGSDRELVEGDTEAGGTEAGDTEAGDTEAGGTEAGGNDSAATGGGAGS